MPAKPISKALKDLLDVAQLIEETPRKSTVEDLVKKRGGSTSDEAFVRKVQHQLNRLKEAFPDELVADGARPQGWSWAKARPIDLDFLTQDMAIALSLVERYMRQLLPATTIEALEPLMKKSRMALVQADKGWGDKLLVKRPGPRRKPPEVSAVVQRIVYDALKSGDVMLKISYQSRQDSQPEQRQIWPLGLMMKNDFLYLVAVKVEPPNDARWYALHRIRSADRVAAKGAQVCPDFSLSAKEAEGWFNNPGGAEVKDIRLVLRVEKGAAVNLLESPLLGMQGEAEMLSNGAVRITADILQTEELVPWLCAYGRHVVVEAPADLRERMRKEADEMLRAYNG